MSAATNEPGSAAGSGGSGAVTCESCGSDEREVYAVHRIYVTPADWDTAGREDVQPDVEHWCYACLASYPHEMVAE